MKKILVVLVAAVIVLVLALVAEAMTPDTLFNGITYFEVWPSCEHAAGIAAGGAGGPILDVTVSNEITRFDTVRYMYGMGSCVNIKAEATPVPVMHNGVTYFELK